MEKIRIGITHGDINGVGYEMILKTFQTEGMASLCTAIVYGSPKAAAYHKKAINAQTIFQLVDSADEAKEGVLNMVNCFGEEEQKIEFGRPSEEAGKAALAALDKALEDLKEGKIDALVTTPICNSSIPQEEGCTFVGQTSYIEEKVGNGKKALKIFTLGNLRVALVTDKMPLENVKENITKENVAEKLVILHNTLKRDFFIDNPRIAVLSLNPSANGEVEKEVLKPVIDELFKRGVKCIGPYESEKFFGNGLQEYFDAILAMYYDQGVSAFKAIARRDGINYTAGLPVLRTAPAMGVCYEEAGKDMIDEQALRNAIYAAVDAARNRMRFDRERANPLKKQYFEKRDDSDKLKLDQVTDDDQA